VRPLAVIRLLALLFSMALAGALAVPASAQDADFGAIKGGIDRLHALSPAVARARNLLGPLSFGPFEISDSCGYKCLGALCFMNWNWNWKFPQFVGFKSALDQRLAAVAAQANNFDPAFAPIRQWLVDTLPQFSAYFDGAVKKLQADTAVIAQPGDAAAVAQANRDIVDTLSQISANLVGGADKLRGGMSGLARFDANLGNALSQVESLGGALDNTINSDRQDINRRMGDWPCGQGDATNRYNGIAAQVRTNFNTVVQLASATGATARQSDNDVSLMLGTVNNLQTRYQGALNQIKAAQTTPQGAVQALRVNVAAAAWHDLAQYAVLQFGK
jgi:hypothetical protein